MFNQGDLGDFYYILSDGACDISKHGRVVLKVRYSWYINSRLVSVQCAYKHTLLLTNYVIKTRVASTL